MFVRRVEQPPVRWVVMVVSNNAAKRGGQTIHYGSGFTKGAIFTWTNNGVI